MIQRIQTLYLLLTALLAVLFLSNEIFTLSDGTFFTLAGIYAQGGDEPAPYWYFSATLIAIPLLALISIFLYRNRKIQIRLTVLLILVIIVMTGLAAFLITRNSDSEIILKPKIFYPVLMLIFSWLALNGIKKDEAIVRSYDRLR